MLTGNRLYFFLFSFLFISLMFLSLPEKSFSGLQPIDECCQFESDQCFDFDDSNQLCRVDDLRPGTCNEETGLCESTPAPIPTLNEWGLISVIIALGIVGAAGIFVYRRKKASA